MLLSTSFMKHEVPFPIVVATSQSKNENRSNIDTDEGNFIPLTNTVFEFSPCEQSFVIRPFHHSHLLYEVEMGSFDPTLGSFTPTKFLGTTNNSVCITNFDQAAFVAGTSSELFNEFNTTVNSDSQC